jgi:hypothetical protein
MRKTTSILISCIGAVLLAGCPVTPGEPVENITFEYVWSPISAPARGPIADLLRTEQRRITELVPGVTPCRFTGNFAATSDPTQRQPEVILNGSPGDPGFNAEVYGQNRGTITTQFSGPCTGTNPDGTARDTILSFRLQSDQGLQLGQRMTAVKADVWLVRPGETVDDILNSPPDFSSDGLYFAITVDSIGVNNFTVGHFEFIAENQTNSNDPRLLVVYHADFGLDTDTRQ